MSKAHYFAYSKSKNDTGADSFSVPFISSFSSKKVKREISQFKLDFPKSKMVWKLGLRYLRDEK